MIDLAMGVESRNYSLKRGSDLVTILGFLKNVVPLFVIACVLSFQLSIRARNIQIGYQTQQLKKQAEKLEQNRKQVALEAQIRRSMEMRDLLSRKDPHSIILRANPPIPHQFDNRASNGWSNPERETLARLSGPQRGSVLN